MKQKIFLSSFVVCFFGLASAHAGTVDPRCLQYLERISPAILNAQSEGKAVSFQVASRFSFLGADTVTGYVQGLMGNILGQTILTVQQDYAPGGNDFMRYGMTQVNISRIMPQTVETFKSGTPILSESEMQIYNTLKQALDFRKHIWFDLRKDILLDRSFFERFLGVGRYDYIEVRNLRPNAKGTTYLVDLMKDDADGASYSTRSIKSIDPLTLRIEK